MYLKSKKFFKKNLQHGVAVVEDIVSIGSKENGICLLRVMIGVYREVGWWKHIESQPTCLSLEIKSKKNLVIIIINQHTGNSVSKL